MPSVEPTAGRTARPLGGSFHVKASPKNSSDALRQGLDPWTAGQMWPADPCYPGFPRAWKVGSGEQWQLPGTFLDLGEPCRLDGVAPHAAFSTRGQAGQGRAKRGSAAQHRADPDMRGPVQPADWPCTASPPRGPKGEQRCPETGTFQCPRSP